MTSWIVKCSWALLAIGAATAAETSGFQAAKPVWPEGRETEKNLTVGFRTVFAAPASGSTRLRLAGSTRYRAFLNGEFLAYGPAKGPHGFHRVDEIDLSARLRPGRNLLAIEVAGYNVNSYDTIDQPSFLEAEVVADSKVLAATGDADHPFDARILDERVQKVQRYSFQRPFSEVYRLKPGFDGWRTDVDAPAGGVACAVLPPREHLDRGVGYCDFIVKPPTRAVATGGARLGDMPANPWKDRSLTTIGPKLRGYPESELTTIPSLELQRIVDEKPQAAPADARSDAFDLKAGSFATVDLGVNRTGFLRSRILAEERTRLFFTFDEILTPDGDVDFKRLGCVNIVACEIEPGTYDFESYEPYTLRFLKLIALDGGCRVENLGLREYAAPVAATARFDCDDERLNRLFAAGVETFRQNAVDVFMDCPSRERAGWLCDSFFTARVALDLQGDARVESNFVENFLKPKSFAHLPAGMLPMCYPADHDDGIFIPNWSLWFVVQLEEYLGRTGDRETVKALEPRLDALLEYFRPFRNSDGLLEKLQSWVFVEWSAANSFVQDVNYPSNMLYAAALAAMGRMYDRPELTRDAEAVRAKIREQSFDGEFFVDNAVRDESGSLKTTRNRTEVCQYFAFFFGAATPESHPKLWSTLRRSFGPSRKGTQVFAEIHPANAFVGDTMRLELLSRAGLSRQILDESLAYQLKMVDLTGTLWENDSPTASCNHGFASHGGVHVVLRDVLGIYAIDPAARTVRLRFADVPLSRCEGSIPVADGAVSLRWKRRGDEVTYRVEAPAGWTISATALGSLQIVEDARLAP